MPRLIRLVYRLGFRPKPDSIFYSYVQHMYYAVVDTMRENLKEEAAADGFE